MFNDEKILKVNQYMTPSYCKEKNSMIVLKGKWLTDLGFTVGKNVSVQVANAHDKIELVLSLVD